MYRLHHRGKLVSVIHTHVDDLLVAGKQIPEVENMLAKAVKELHLKQSADSFIYCGRTITITKDAILISMAASCRDCGPNLTLPTERRKQKDSPVTAAEKSEYRALLGKQQWCTQNCRIDFACEVNKMAQKIEKATVQISSTLATSGDDWLPGPTGPSRLDVTP